MTSIDSILKSRTITLLTNVSIVKAMVFPGVMYGCESWTRKKAEDNSFQLGWGRPLRVLWTARRSDQSILKKINPEYSLEGLILKLKLQYFGHLMWRANSLEKTLMLEKWKAKGEVDDGGWDDWMVSLTQWTWVWADSGRWWRTGKLGKPGGQKWDLTEPLSSSVSAGPWGDTRGPGSHGLGVCCFGVLFVFQHLTSELRSFHASSVVLSWEHLCPQGILGAIWRHFWLSLGQGVQWVVARDAA